jgi:hypothetical protein
MSAEHDGLDHPHRTTRHHCTGLSPTGFACAFDATSMLRDARMMVIADSSSIGGEDCH